MRVVRGGGSEVVRNQLDVYTRARPPFFLITSPPAVSSSSRVLLLFFLSSFCLSSLEGRSPCSKQDSRKCSLWETSIVPFLLFFSSFLLFRVEASLRGREGVLAGGLVEGFALGQSKGKQARVRGNGGGKGGREGRRLPTVGGGGVAAVVVEWKEKEDQEVSRGGKAGEAR